MVIKVFKNPNELKIIKKIVDSKNGLWAKIQPVFEEAITNRDIKAAISSLEQMRDLNKSVLVLASTRLSELAKKLEGKIVSVKKN